MPAPFVSPQDIVDSLGRGTITDPGMLIATDSACDIVRDLAEREFTAGTATVTLDGSGTDALPLPNRYLPINAAGTVTVNGGAVTDYALNGNGILFRGTAGVDPRPVWPSGRQNVVATVEYGYAADDLPRSVRAVALALAVRGVTQGAAIQESVGPVSVRYAVAATDLTAGERAILAKYRQVR